MIPMKKVSALVLGGVLLFVSIALAASNGKLTVAYVADVGGLNDHGYNEYTYDGMKAGAKATGAHLFAIESRGPQDYAKNLRTAAQSAQLTVVSGFAMGDALKTAAKEFPNRKFAIIDFSYSPSLPNVQGDVFAANESSYLAGIVAAGISKSHVIGFVGGVDSPVLEDFLAGYEAGALAENPHTHIKVSWTGSFTNQQAGKQAGLAEVSQHADVIYAAAGASGLGALAAAQETHVWAIGVDQDQHNVAPDTVITSVVKHVNVAAMDNVEAVAKGDWKPGTKLFNLANNGVGLAPYHNLASDVPAAVKQAVATAKQNIIAGKITVPHKPQYPTGN